MIILPCLQKMHKLTQTCLSYGQLRPFVMVLVQFYIQREKALFILNLKIQIVSFSFFLVSIYPTINNKGFALISGNAIP
jgi:hypothetical protein